MIETSDKYYETKALSLQPGDISAYDQYVNATKDSSKDSFQKRDVKGRRAVEPSTAEGPSISLPSAGETDKTRST